jgi:hypothetical protein
MKPRGRPALPATDPLAPGGLRVRARALPDTGRGFNLDARQRLLACLEVLQRLGDRAAVQRQESRP